MEPRASNFQTSDQKLFRTIWLVIASGVVMLSVVSVFLVQSGSGGAVKDGSLFILLNGVVGVGAIASGFMIQRKLDEALLSAATYENALGLIRSRGIISIAVVEGSALFAAISVLLTGDVMNLAFVVPFFAFAWLFYPSEARFAYWHAIWQAS